MQPLPDVCRGSSYLSPVLSQRVCGCPQVVPWDLAVHMVGHVHINVMGQELHPAEQIASHHNPYLLLCWARVPCLPVLQQLYMPCMTTDQVISQAEQGARQRAHQRG